MLTTIINWDNANSDVNIDVFDAFGAQIAASPVRGKGEKQKKLFTQIDKPGTYYIRVTAPTKADGTVYTMEAQWQEPPAVVVDAAAAAAVEEKPVVEEKPKHHASTPREPREPREKPAGETHPGARGVGVSARAASLMMYIDKGSAAGIHAGDSGIVLQGSRRRRSRRRRHVQGHQGHRRQQVRRLGVAALARQEQPRRDHTEPVT